MFLSLLFFSLLCVLQGPTASSAALQGMQYTEYKYKQVSSSRIKGNVS